MLKLMDLAWQILFHGLEVSYLLVVKFCDIIKPMQVTHVAQNKQIYIIKKRVVPVNSENYRELLLFGLLSPSPLLQLSSTVEQVIVIPSIILYIYSHGKNY